MHHKLKQKDNDRTMSFKPQTEFVAEPEVTF